MYVILQSWHRNRQEAKQVRVWDTVVTQASRAALARVREHVSSDCPCGGGLADFLVFRSGSVAPKKGFCRRGSPRRLPCVGREFRAPRTWMCVLLPPVTQVPSRSGEQHGRWDHVMVSRLLGPFETPNFEVLRH